MGDEWILKMDGRTDNQGKFRNKFDATILYLS